MNATRPETVSNEDLNFLSRFFSLYGKLEGRRPAVIAFMEGMMAEKNISEETRKATQ